MKKVVLISMVAASALFADMMTDMAKDAAMSKAKSTAKETVIKQVAGDDPVKKEIVKKVADKVAPEPSPTDKIKSAVADKVMGGAGTSNVSSSLGKAVTGGASTGTSGILDKVSGTTKEPTVKEKATDMAVEKVVGSNPVKKEVAKEAVKSLGM